MRGETVVIERREQAGSDSLGAAVWRPAGTDEIGGVLVAPGSPEGLREDNRPNGALVRYTLYLPSAWDGCLSEGDVVLVRGERCRVIGVPQDWRPAGCPGLYGRVAEVEASHG
jgi:hypothetical protein